ncbi:MAG: ABC transporter ATP-binding protein [Patescibacteria group bacterium]
MQVKKPRKTGHAWSVLKDYARATAKYPWFFFGVLLGIATTVGTSIAAPLFLKHFIDLVTTIGVNQQYLHAMLLTLGLYTLSVTGNWLGVRIQMWTVTQLEARVARDLFTRGFNYLVGHGHDFFINNFAGTLTRRVSRYSHAYQQIFNSVMEGMVPTFLFTAGVIVVLFTQNIYLGIGLLTWTILFVFLMYLITIWRYKYKLARAAQDSRLTGVLSDTVGNHSAVTLFAAEVGESKHFASVVYDWYQATIRSWNSDVLVYGIQGFLTRFAQVALLLVGFYLWWQGSITVGSLVLVQIYAISLIDQIGSISGNLRQLFDALSEAHEMIEVMEEPHAIQDIQGASELAVPEGAISFNSVGFAFADKSEVLSDFDLNIKPGQRVALVGPSGAGKTTITKLLLRLHDVTSGSIAIDGTDIKTVTQQSLRRAIAFVPQESTLFHRSLKENIAYGKPDATDEEIIAAAKKAHCHEFISKLAEGYDTHVGERGVKLSGGERQRVAIARAILKNAPILVLDEATSALDSESESLIQDALKTLMEGKTVIVIAHRLSTIMKMDRIIVIEDGKIAADGNHDDLLKQEGGLYHKLWSIQAGSFLTDEDL